MGLRKELNEIPPGYAAEALSGQLASADQNPVYSTVDLIEKYKTILADYPALQMLFALIAEASLSLETYSLEEKRSVLEGAGAALEGVKAMANKQIFDDLELPTDLQE